MNLIQLALCGGLIALFLLSGLLRLAASQASELTSFASLATPLYVAATIAGAVLLTRAGAPLRRMGFEHGPTIRGLGLAVIGVVVIQAGSELLAPLWELGFGEQRDLDRFSGIERSLPDLVSFLLLSWTVAAFGEEVAFRVVLLRGLRSALGGARPADVAALVIQAAVFGLIHLYQGPAGVGGAAVSGLVYGVLALAGGGAIWPSAFAHGVNNTIGLLTIYLGRS